MFRPKETNPRRCSTKVPLPCNVTFLLYRRFLLSMTRKDARTMTQPKTMTYPVYVGTRFPADLAQTLKTQAQRTGSSMSDLIRLAVAAQLNNSPEANNG